MASRYEKSAGNIGSGISEVTNTNSSGFIPSTQNSSTTQNSYGYQNSQSDSESFSGISNPDALASLLSFIKTGINGNPQYQAQLARRQGVAGEVNTLLGTYSKEAAFRDAQILMQQNLQKSMESQMPAIMSAIQGAGTSASSMQGLLSQRLAQDAAQAAGASGAAQATSYGNIAANLSNTLEALTRIDNSGTTDYLKALELLRESTSKSTSSSRGENSSQSLSTSSATGATPADNITQTRTLTPNSGGGNRSGSVGGGSSYNGRIDPSYSQFNGSMVDYLGSGVGGSQVDYLSPRGGGSTVDYFSEYEW